MERSDEPMTSERLAKVAETNAVVVRRILAGVRDAGIVRSSKGHRGGWSLARDPKDLSLLAIHEALGAPPTVVLGFRREEPDCLVEAAVNDSLRASIKAAESLLLDRLGELTLAVLATRVRRRARARRGKGARAIEDACGDV